jgi:hypothetical protein
MYVGQEKNLRKSGTAAVYVNMAGEKSILRCGGSSLM